MGLPQRKQTGIDYSTACLNALAVARAFVRREAPYYSTIIYGLVPHFVEGIHTLGVTKGMALLIDPKWYVEMEQEVGHVIKANPALSKEEAALSMRAGVLVHEANHILRGIDRIDSMIRSGIDKLIVNRGFDMPINDDIRATGWHLPSWAVYPDKYGFPSGLTGEQYVELLMQMKEKQPDKFCKIQEMGGAPSVGSGKCGGCGGNGEDEFEAKVDSEVGRPKADQQRIRKEAIIQVREEAAAGRGNIPASLKELIDVSEKRSVVPWRTRLRRTIRRATGRIQVGRADFSLRRPSKRSYSRGLVRPGMIDKKPEILCIEDSSGSMGPEQLKAVRVEIKGIFTQLGIPEVWFCDIDAAVASKPQRLRLSDLATLPVHGRGGTDFRPGIEMAKHLVPKPDILIYLTDGDGPAPASPPKGLTVVWCIVPTPYGRRPARWGELVLVTDDQKLMDPYEVSIDDEDEDV
jgi:predicted metal-dependent peptidase